MLCCVVFQGAAGAGSALAQLQHLLLTQHGAHSLLLHTQVSRASRTTATERLSVPQYSQRLPYFYHINLYELCTNMCDV